MLGAAVSDVPARHRNPRTRQGAGGSEPAPPALPVAAGLLLCLAPGAVPRVQLHPWVLALFLALKGCRLCNAPGKAGHGVPQPARALEQCVPQPGPGPARGVRDDATCYSGGQESGSATWAAQPPVVLGSGHSEHHLLLPAWGETPMSWASPVPSAPRVPCPVSTTPAPSWWPLITPHCLPVPTLSCREAMGWDYPPGTSLPAGWAHTRAVSQRPSHNF